ncbi:ATP-dependent DNA helicase Q4 [Pholidichthys leucotaenia]
MNMDRYNEVKLLLKSWEQNFVQQHHRKPNKEDIVQAPEETRKLYKEYKNLKQAKENSSSRDAASDHPTTTQPNTEQKEQDCWGAHLNRSAMSVPSPKLTSQDRDSLKASSQYYGLKLKNNLTILSKERPVSLKKSNPSGRIHLNTLKDGKTAATHNPSPAALNAKTTNTDLENCHMSPGNIRPNLECLGSKTLELVEPEEPFEPFEPIKESSDEPAAAADVSNPVSKDINSPGRPSAIFSSLSPQCTKAVLKRDVKVSEKEYTRASEDIKENGETSQSPVGGVDPPGVGASVGFKGRSEFCGNFRRGFGRRPSPANRLSLVDKLWLERCQVFGEMVNEEKPGGGNQELKLEKEMKLKEGEREENLNEKGSLNSLRDEHIESIRKDKTVSDNVLKCVQEPAGKSKGGEEGKEQTEVDCESSPKRKGAKKKGRKRQREVEDMEGKTTEGAVKKRRRNGKKKGESASCGGAGQRKNNKKKDEHGEAKEETDAAEPKKVPQENLLGEIDEEIQTKKITRTQSVKLRVSKGAEGNFVKINLKKKSHVKGYALKGVALRRQLTMQKFHLKGERFGGGGGLRGGFRGGFSRQGDTCYKCGGTGHWAVDCKGRAPPLPVPEDKSTEEKPFELPTLEDVARATGTLQPQPVVGPPSIKDGQHQLEKEVGSSNKDGVLLNVIRPDYECPVPPPPMEPIYHLTEDGKVQETPGEVYATLRDFGYQSFRAGQEEAIMRILSGLSTLVVLSTGMGKSLCYQLPAYLYAQRSKCITLVISPLVSLMDDQLSGVPAKLKAACIHSNMTMKQRKAVIEKVKSGQVCVLLLSPEALVGGGGSGSGCLPSAQELPPVAFACIDEAHCVSEWSHNFRPCYLRLCKVLRERLGVRCLLGLTATATLSTALDIAHHLDISDQDGIAVRSAAVPPNLNLSVSMDRQRDQALVSLLKGDRFGCLDSIIVYCTRREETVRVAALIRTCLQGVLLKENKTNSSSETQNNPVGQRKKELARKKIRKPLKWQAESYHAGLSGSERRRVQNNFMCGELRIVVATVAFGMGLDKSDVRGIIHYNMPKSFESYVQEIGRAGRDGEPAHCHLFLDPEGDDLHELHRHIYADTVDYYTVKRLVQKVFPACKCKQIHQKQQELFNKDVEDSELLEMMDICDREGSMARQQDKEQMDKTQPEAQQKTTDLNSAEVQRQEEGVGGEEKEESEGRTFEVVEADCQDQEVESCDWPRERVCHTHGRAIPIQETVEALDITEGGVETLLCYLELHPQHFVELLHPTLSMCKISCYDGPRQMRKITKICHPVAVVLARKQMAGECVKMCDEVEFDVVEVADTMGWELPLVKRGLRQLQWSTDRAGGRSGVLVEFSSLSFHFRSYGDLDDDEMDRVCQFLHSRVQEQERTQLYQLTACFKAFKSVAYQSVLSCVDDLDESRSLQLKNLLSEYFDKMRDRDHTLTPVDLEELDKYKLLDWENQIRADIRSFLSHRSDEKFSGRAVARILHGIGSPCYPAQTYGRDRRFWRKYIRFDFNQLIRLATQEIINFK